MEADSEELEDLALEVVDSAVLKIQAVSVVLQVDLEVQVPQVDSDVSNL